jgi:hypothetical protein
LSDRVADFLEVHGSMRGRDSDKGA